MAHVGEGERESEWGGSGRSSVSGVARVSDKIESKRFSGSRVASVAGVLDAFELGRPTVQE